MFIVGNFIGLFDGVVVVLLVSEGWVVVCGLIV